jgi:hypothetical protein
MNMPNRMIKRLLVVTAILAFGFHPETAYSQSPGGRTALAARQRLKNEVLDAMSDGKITRLERAEILAEAKENLTVKEYEGLKATMDRLSPPEVQTAAKRSATQRAIAASMQDRPESTSFFSRMVSHVPYIDDLKSGPRPQASNLARSIPYAKSGSIDLSGAQQALAKAPKLNETYLDPPTVDRPLPKITHNDRAPAAGRAPVKPNLTRKNPAEEKQIWSKYADESISPMPNEVSAAESGMVQQPRKVMEEMAPLAKSPEDNTLSMPAGALLPDRGVTSTKADYSQPVQPEQVELEFLR